MYAEAIVYIVFFIVQVNDKDGWSSIGSERADSNGFIVTSVDVAGCLGTIRSGCCESSGCESESND